MGNSYVRQSSADIVDGQTVFAAPLNAEFNAIQNFADGITGHSHDGTVGEGPKINLTTSVIGVLPIINGGSGGISKFNATTAPTVTDDANDGYTEGSLWVDITNNVFYINLDATPGAAIWQRFQPYNLALSSIAGLTTSSDQMIYTTASNAYSTTSLTPFGRTILDDIDAAAVRTTIGLGSMSTQNSNAVSITGGSFTGTLTSNSVNITGGTITNITDLAISDGGTGASTASAARDNLGLTIGTNVQAYDTELAAIAGLTSSANKLPYFTGSGTAALADFTAAGRALVDDADAAAQRVTIGLGNVDNTSDLNKPVSTATQTALNLHGHHGHIFGLTLSNNLTDPTNDIDISIGSAVSDDFNNPISMNLTSSITKRLDASWSVGTGNGGLDTGSISNATYHVWLIQRSDTGVVDALFSLSATAPTMPTNYDRKRRIGSIIRSGGTILGFSQNGDTFILNVGVNDRSSTAAFSSALLAVTVPTGIVVQPIMLSTQAQNAVGNIQTRFASAGYSAGTYVTTVASQEIGSVYINSGIFTNTSAQIQFAVTIIGGSLFSNDLITRGWIDNRGKT